MSPVVAAPGSSPCATSPRPSRRPPASRSSPTSRCWSRSTRWPASWTPCPVEVAGSPPAGSGVRARCEATAANPPPDRARADRARAALARAALARAGQASGVLGTAAARAQVSTATGSADPASSGGSGLHAVRATPQGATTLLQPSQAPSPVSSQLILLAASRLSPRKSPTVRRLPRPVMVPGRQAALSPTPTLRRPVVRSPTVRRPSRRPGRLPTRVCRHRRARPPRSRVRRHLRATRPGSPAPPLRRTMASAGRTVRPGRMARPCTTPHPSPSRSVQAPDRVTRPTGVVPKHQMDPTGSTVVEVPTPTWPPVPKQSP